jgi:hypothetical protein
MLPVHVNGGEKLGGDKFRASAISLRDCQNSSSNTMLVLYPPMLIERFRIRDPVILRIIASAYPSAWSAPPRSHS